MLDGDETCPTCSGLGNLINLPSGKPGGDLRVCQDFKDRIYSRPGIPAKDTSKLLICQVETQLAGKILSETTIYSCGSKSSSSEARTDVEDYTALLDQNFLRVAESFDNPQEVLKDSLEKLKENRWQTSTPALINLMQIGRFHPEFLDSVMGLVNRNLCSLLKNIRPQIVRTACQLSREFYKSIQYAQRPEFDELVSQLLLKSTHIKQGIREDARNALRTMIRHLPPTTTVRILTGANETGHKNQFIRAVISMLLCDIVELIGPDTLLTNHSLKEVCRRVLTCCLKFLVDGNLEARNNAKKALKLMMGHDNFDLLCSRYVDPKLAKFVNPQLVALKYS